MKARYLPAAISELADAARFYEEARPGYWAGRVEEPKSNYATGQPAAWDYLKVRGFAYPTKMVSDTNFKRRYDG